MGSEATITPAATPSTTVDHVDVDAAIPSSDITADHIQAIDEDRIDQPDQGEASTPWDADEGETPIEINQRADIEERHNTPEAISIQIEALDQGWAPPSDSPKVSGESTRFDAIENQIDEQSRKNPLHIDVEEIVDEAEVGYGGLEPSIGGELDSTLMMMEQMMND